MTDYSEIKAARGPEVTRYIAAHEIGHAWIVRALGNRIEYVTVIPNGVYAGHCMRSGTKTSSLNFVDDREPALETELAPSTNDIVALSAKIGAPEFGMPRVNDAEAFIRAQSNVLELVAGDVCMRVMYPQLSLHFTEHDWTEARAFASVFCATASGVDAFLRYAEAEVEAIIREHIHVVTALIDALADRGTLSGENVERIIHEAIPGELLALAREHRLEMQARVKSGLEFEASREGRPC